MAASDAGGYLHTTGRGGWSFRIDYPCRFPPAALAAGLATTSVPIVFVVDLGPVAAGFVASFNKPDGNGHDLDHRPQVDLRPPDCGQPKP
jgi:hypothetical protein